MKSILNLRNVATMLACFAVSLMLFTGCEPEDPIDIGTEQDADIVAFTFDGIDGKASIDKSALTVTAKAGETVDLTAIVAEFTLSKDATAKVGSATQESGVTANNFTSPVTYKVTSGDGATLNDWTVTVTKEGGAQGTAFTKLTFKTVKDIIDFFPVGVFVYEWEDKSWNNDIELFAKASDGSFTFGEFDGDPKSSRYENAANWFIWEGENYHSIDFTNKDGVTHWWQVKAEYPDENLTQSTDTKMGLKAISVSTPWGGNPSAAPAESTVAISLLLPGLTPFLAFIASDDCEKAVFEENATLEGIACKKYSVTGYSGKTYYYVLDNGFCLKKDNPEGTSSWTDYYLKKGERNVTSFDAVLQKYYHNSETYSKPTAVAQMQVLTRMRNGADWYNPSSDTPPSGGWIIPWTAGGIKHKSWFYELGKAFPHTYHIELDNTKFTDAERIAYFTQVKAIPYMKVKSDSDMGTDESYRSVSFEANNNDDALSAGLTFGDSYYYIGYDFSMSVIYSNPFICRLYIFWVKVTIV
jgi:hypothetical protein